MASTAFPLISFPEKTSPGRHPLVLSQGEVRPGVKQGQHWVVGQFQRHKFRGLSERQAISSSDQM